MNQIDANWVAAHTKHRLTKGHKKTFGHVLVIAGSPGKVGSGILCARAALHAGCGLVTAMIPSEGVAALLAGNPEIMYSTGSLRELDLSNFDAIAIGPGIGFSDEAVDNVRYLLQTYFFSTHKFKKSHFLFYKFIKLSWFDKRLKIKFNIA